MNMKKLVLLLAAAVALTASAAGSYKSATTARAIEKAPKIGLITSQPEGEAVTYARAGQSMVADSNGSLYLMEQEGIVTVVYGDDNKVYIKDPIYGLTGNDFWAEGTIEGNEIHMPMGQKLLQSDYGYALVLAWVTSYCDPSDGYVYFAVEDVDDAVFVIDGNTITLQGTTGDIEAEFPDNVAMTGLSAIWDDDLSCPGDIDINTVLNKQVIAPAVPADPRLDYEALGKDAWYDCGTEGGYSRLSYLIEAKDVDGNDIIPDFMTYSIYTDDDQLFTFDAHTYSWDFDEDVTEVPFTHSGYDVNPTSAYIYRTNAAGYETFFTQRIGVQVHYTVDGVKNSSNIVYWYLPAPSDYAANGTPADPQALTWSDGGDESGWSVFAYALSDTTTDGEIMDPERIYYSVYTDNDLLFTFEAGTYIYDFDENTSIVPYNHLGWDVCESYAYFYRTNAEGYDPLFNQRIGIRQWYEQEDGTLVPSNIIYLEGSDDPTQVAEVAAGKTVASTRYFNMAGQEMSEAKGICIAVTTYTDGTTSAVKVVK